ncbi:MAG TPA: hypothetical protein VFG35_11935 [Actinoplanes sp.]|nr:hypothetical protein [Actinoplanes sp.]
MSHTLWASTASLTRRLTGTTTATWRTGDKDMNMAHSILDLITERQTVVAAAIATLREQIDGLTRTTHRRDRTERPYRYK